MAEADGGVKRIWEGQGRRLALWLPPLIALGIWLRFGDHRGGELVLAVAVLAVAAIRVARPYAMIAGLAILSGGLAAQVRLAAVDAPMLGVEWQGAVEGRVVLLDRSSSGRPRVILDELSMPGVADPPLRVRMSLGRAKEIPRVGDRIAAKAVLAAPRGPVEAGAFDFSRRAHFRRLGAVGYATGGVAVERVEEADLPVALRVGRLRGAIADWLRARIGGAEGAVAAALVVGDRSGIPAEARDALRDSGLAHLLAISGLHVGLLSALVYWSVRIALALPPRLSEQVSTRKIAAVLALAAAAAYLVMSGASVATQRAFIMAAVAFLAILFDRLAVTMRGLAVAAILILLLRPESLYEAGFQMSFAAVAALVAGYDATRGFWRRRAKRRGIGSKLATGAMATVMTSVLAGAATAPFAAYHFNRLVVWSLPANLLATPLMGLWIMPCIILTALLAPFGLAGMPLYALGIGIGVILKIATYFGGGVDAVLGIAAAAPVALPLVVFAGLWLTIWRGPLRLVGILPLVAGLLVWSPRDRPDLFVSANATLIAGRGEDGQLWVGRSRAEGYTADLWLRRDGEARPDRAAAHRRREWSCNRRRCRGWTGDDWRIVYLRQGEPNREDCAPRTVLVAPHLRLDPDGSCLGIDRTVMDGASGLTVTFPEGGEPIIRTARPWRRQ